MLLLIPGLAAADIKSSTSASSESGGNVLGPGGKVTTGGASASVSTSNTSGSSSSSVYIKTDANGVVHEETYTTNKSTVDVSVQTMPQGSEIEVREGVPPTVVRHEVVVASSSTESASGTANASATTTPQEPGIGLGAQIVLVVQSIFMGLLSWFR